ncbi:MAG: hypothetical protein LCH70_14160 [Proteobacteria bacterium]|nr:hypothetical protein [Pseudomonadota bacterium]
MKRHLLAALLAGAAFAVALPATTMAQDEPEEADSSAATKKPDDRFCIQETGSRIVASRNKSKKADKDCVSANGRVYTRQDIESTGSVDLRDALRRLDPSIN